MLSTVLKTKLFIPPLPSGLVPRPRLSEQIDAAIRRGIGLTLIAAPAGFGKTTAISNWLHETNLPAAWISLDENENEPAVFWTYVIAALQTIRPEFGEMEFANLASAPSIPVNKIVAGLVNELVGLAGPVILILDDYHRISNQVVHDSLLFLLNHRPPDFHLVIVTRADPPLPVARLRAQRALVELRTADLRFTEDEACVLLNEIMGLDLTAEDIRLLEDRTEGWGVGLVLAAQSMQGRSDKREFITAFSGSHHYILEYLIQEVLNRQPKPLREFLLRTSILDELYWPLCDAVAGVDNSNETLVRLLKDNLFIIPLDQEHAWYRYHHLFGELLVDHLKKEFAEEEIRELHRRASHWYERAERLDLAVKYALQGQDYQRAADLIELAAGETISRGQVKSLLQWIHALPDRIIEVRPQLLMRLGWSTFLSGKVDEASQFLNEAAQAFVKIPPGRDMDILQGQLFAMLSTLTALTSDLATAMAQAVKALEKLPEGDFNYRARAARALGVCNMFLGDMETAIKHLEEAKTLALKGQNNFLTSEILSQIATVWMHQGRLNQAFQTYQKILYLYDRYEEAPPACLGFIGMAAVSLEWNDLAAAEKYLDSGIELCLKGHIGYPLPHAYFIQGLLRQARGDSPGALEAIGKGENLSRIGGGSLESVLGLAWYQVRFNLLAGEVNIAEQWANGQMLPPGWSFEDLPLVLHEFQQNMLARVYLNKGEAVRAVEICDRLYEQAQASGRMARVIELRLVHALALHALERKAEAFESFERCLTLAEPEGYTRLFLEAGASVRNLLQQAVSRSVRQEYAARLLAAFETSHPKTSIKGSESATQPQMVEKLTDRELEVLQLMSRGWSNLQIAEALIVSVNTVKKHTSNLYGKLGVRNRAQAVLRAKEIGLV